MRVVAVVLSGMAALVACGSSPTSATRTCTYTLSTSSLVLGAQEGSGAVAVSTASQCAWTAQADAAWIALTGPTNGTGPGTVRFGASANSDATARTAAITIAGQVLTVKQEALACTVTLSPESRSFGPAGGTGSLDVVTGSTCAWTATSGAPWVAIGAGGQGIGSGTVTFAVAANTSAATRSAAIAVADRSISVTQSGTSTCSYQIEPDDEAFGVSGGTGSVSVRTDPGCAWTARANATWLRITAPGNGQGAGSGDLSYAVEANTSADARTGSVVIADKTLVVTQSGARACDYSVSPVDFALCVNGGERSIALTAPASCPWTVSASASWIAVTTGQSGQGPGTITFRVQDNDDGLARDGRVMVRWPTPTEGQNVRVAQSGCLYGISGTTDFGAAGGVGRLSVYSQPEPYCGGPFGDACSWTARSSAAWIKISTTMPRSGDNDVAFVVAANEGPSARSGTITIAYKVVVITQSGR